MRRFFLVLVQAGLSHFETVLLARDQAQVSHYETVVQVQPQVQCLTMSRLILSHSLRLA